MATSPATQRWLDAATTAVVRRLHPMCGANPRRSETLYHLAIGELGHIAASATAYGPGVTTDHMLR